MTEARDDAIRRLMNAYCYRIDAGDLDGFAELFRHATWRIGGDSGGGDTGAAAVRETFFMMASPTPSM